jgi:hypothetical protein
VVVHAVLLSNLVRLISTDSAIFFQIDFVTYNYYGGRLVFYLVNRLNPITDRLKCLLICQIKAKNDSIRLSIELVSNIAELLLASCVPNLDSNSLVVF